MPGFGVRVAPSGRKTFVLMARFSGRKNPTRRAIGTYGPISLADCPREGQGRLVLFRRKTRRHRRAITARLRPSLGAFIEAKVRHERKGVTATRTVRKLIDRWGTTPSATSPPQMFGSCCANITTAPQWLISLFVVARRLFGWAINQGDYGIEHAPTDRLKARVLVGPRNMRARILSDSEIRAIWHADLGYPMQPLLRIMLLTGQRKSEVANAQWYEFDLDKRIWVVPAGRMKAGAAHVVPLSDGAIDLLRGLPRFDRGDHLFSFTFGDAQ